jgi:hypothetical protein
MATAIPLIDSSSDFFNRSQRELKGGISIDLSLIFTFICRKSRRGGDSNYPEAGSYREVSTFPFAGMILFRFRGYYLSLHATGVKTPLKFLILNTAIVTKI